MKFLMKKCSKKKHEMNKYLKMLNIYTDKKTTIFFHSQFKLKIKIEELKEKITHEKSQE